MGLGIKTKILGTNIGNWVHCYYSMKKNGHITNDEFDTDVKRIAKKNET